jgi:hypothetical protein
VITTLQVKLVKCVVEDVVVDVSFDTLGGLCTVAYLETMDRRIGRGHLFKRSIMLVSVPRHAGRCVCVLGACGFAGGLPVARGRLVRAAGAAGGSAKTPRRAVPRCWVRTAAL